MKDSAYTEAPTAIVIGAGLGGLAAAMRLGAKGGRVTVLDRLDAPGGRGTAIEKDGYRFDLGPTIVTAPEIFRDLWAACGRDFHQDVDLRALDPFYEIRWPDGASFKACGDDARMREQVAQLSPGDVKGYEKFLQASYRRYVVGYEGMVAKPMNRAWETIKVLPEFAALRADRSILGMARAYVKDERLRMALSFHPLFIGGDPRNVTSMYALVSHLEKDQGVHYAIGGVAAIAKAMQRVIEDQGGAIHFGATVDEITFAGTRATGVRLESGEVIAADITVSNADPGHTNDHLMRHKLKRRWTPGKLGYTKWSMGLFVWYFGTRGTRDMWPDVGHHTILAGPRYEGLLKDIFTRGHLADDMSLYVHRPSVTDPGVAPEGDDTFYALSPVPHLGHSDPVDWSEMTETYRQKVLANLEQRLMPGLAERITASEIFTPDTFRDRYLSPVGCGFSIEPRILQSAWFRPHNVSEEADGLYLVGAGTHPGAGLPGVISSAEVLAKLVPDAPQAHNLEMAAE